MAVGPSVRQDKYILGQSQKKSIDTVGEEIRLDLSLNPNPNLNGGTITGTVKDSNGNPIKGALIKIMGNDYEPLAHVFTGDDGSFIFTPFPPRSNYRIFASAQGYVLKENQQFTILANQEFESNFTLTKDPNANLGIIAGDLFRADTSVPINGAAVSLYTIGANNEETLYALSFTNQYGQFVFSDVPQSSYTIKVNALGYYSFSSSAAITSGGQIVNVVASINPNPNSSRGTVSGLITDNNNQAIPNADVTLYKVETINSKESLTAVAYTKTNTDGAYLFINVDQGNYLVKSNQYVAPQQV